ncbi:MAG: DUF4344 domain-containing metallopeptidase [Anaeromyxobacter sp.]
MRRAALLAALLAAPLAAAAPPAKPAAPAGTSQPKQKQVRFAYDAPTDPAHERFRAHLRERKVLETFADIVGTVRLPRPLTLRFASCEGTSNAWYDVETHEVTFCYELVAEFDAAAEGAAKYGIVREDAADGPVVFVMLHEVSHALFDLLQVPVLGREEDAADQVAAYVLLRAGTGVARRTLAGTAWMYKHDAEARAADESDFADVHGLDAQRLYNVLCMAYGADAQAYAGLVEKGYLPRDRAETCADEYKLVGFAVRKLISGSLDPEAVERTRATYKQRWDAPRPAPAPAAGPGGP